ncbi:hypothetical protein GCM10009551_012040 [Nocardiopsis tropica]|uniref:hypothetical protein n=1 Tax=Nocardiopsis tropica TaxID=109330 RepID=UPI0031DDF034
MRLRTLLAATALTAAALAAGAGTAVADEPLDQACAAVGGVLDHPLSPVSLNTTTSLPVDCLVAP